MYRLVSGKVEACPENLPNWSGYGRYVQGLDTKSRQERGCYTELIERAGITQPTLAPDEDAILVSPAVAPATAFPISKIKLFEQCSALGIWEAVHQAIQSDSEAKTRFELATVLMSDDEDFRKIMSALAPSIGKTEKELIAMLSDCASI